MAKVLIVFGSGEGQTARVAEFVGERLRSQGHEVDIFKGKRLPRGFDISRYAAIIVAASVRAMKYQKYIVRFTQAYSAQLAAVPSAFVSVSMAQVNADKGKGGFPQKWLDHFIQETGWQPARFASFAGALAYRKYNIFTRFAMKKVAKQNGLPTDTSRNHEFTDWDAVRRFADEFAENTEQ